MVDKVKLVNGSQFKELYNEQLANQKDDPFDYTGWDANTDWKTKFSKLLSLQTITSVLQGLRPNIVSTWE